MLDLQHVLGAALDVLGDLMAVRRSQLKRPKDQHVECAAKQFDFVHMTSHGRNPTNWEDCLPSRWLQVIFGAERIGFWKSRKLNRLQFRSQVRRAITVESPCSPLCQLIQTISARRTWISASLR